MIRTTFTSYRALLALGALMLIWGSSWSFMKQAMAFSGPFTFSALITGIGAAVLLFVWAIRGCERPPPLLPTFAVGLIQITGFQSLVQCALVDGGAGKTVLLVYTMPFWSALFAWAILHERPTWQFWKGLGLAALGIVLVLEPWSARPDGLSSALAMGAGLCWGLGVVLSKHLFRNTAGSVLPFTAWQMLMGALGLSLIALSVNERAIEWSTPFLISLIYSSVVATSLAWLLWSYVVDRLPVSVSGLSSLVVPITGAIFAWLMLGEQPTLSGFIGMAGMLAAIAVVSVKPSTGNPDL